MLFRSIVGVWKSLLSKFKPVVELGVGRGLEYLKSILSYTFPKLLGAKTAKLRGILAKHLSTKISEPLMRTVMDECIQIAAIRIARNLLAMDVAVSIIATATGLDPAFIESLNSDQ